MIKITGIKVKFGKEELELTPEEAIELRNELNRVFPAQQFSWYTIPNNPIYSGGTVTSGTVSTYTDSKVE